MRRLSGLLVCLLALAAPAVATAGAGAEPLVIGGSGAAQGELPSVVFVAYLVPNGTREGIVCTGTVVAPRFVLTAAHCLHPERVRFDVGNFRVVVGDVNFRGPKGRVLGVTRALEYPGYLPWSGVHDVGLLELAKPAGVPSLRLAERRFWSAGAAAEIAGWGKVRPSQRRATYRLHSGSTNVWGSRECRAYGALEGQICARTESPPRATVCFGDSGGPLLVRRPGSGRLVEIGLTRSSGSRSRRYCDPEEPAIFTSTVPVYHWVHARLAEGPSTAPGA